MANWMDFVDPAAPSGRYLRWKEVERSTGLSRTTAWRLQRSGDFPRPYVISPGRVGYLESEVEAWRASRGHRPSDGAPDERREQRPPPSLDGQPPPAHANSEAAVVRPSATARPTQSPRGRVRRERSGLGAPTQIRFDF